MATFLESLMKADPDDLKEIETKITELENQLDGLRAARKVLAARLNVDVDTPQKRAYQKRKENAATPTKEMKEDEVSPLAKKVYDLLKENGSMPLPAIAATVGTPAGPLSRCLNSAAVRSWFVVKNGEIHIA